MGDFSDAALSAISLTYCQEAREWVCLRRCICVGVGMCVSVWVGRCGSVWV